MLKTSKALTFVVLVAAMLTSCARQPIVSKDIESPFFGDPQAKAQLVIFSDFQCPACIFFHDKIGKKLISDYVKTGKVGYTFKNFPLPFHKNAPDDALAAMCAHAQGKFLDFADRMYALEEAKNGLNVEDSERVKIAQDVGLDPTKFTTCVTEGHYINKIASDMQEGQAKDIPGTPSVFLNGNQMKFSSEQEFFGIVDMVLSGGDYTSPLRQPQFRFKVDSSATKGK